MLYLLGRTQSIFHDDFAAHMEQIQTRVDGKNVLVLGAAGTIGQAVSKELAKLHPARLDVVDISENNLVELVRDIRSSSQENKTEFNTFCLDIGSAEYRAFVNCHQDYHYIFNLSALKHVRSEKDPFTLMRMLAVNILNTRQTLQDAAKMGCDKYFAVSTDKATKPINMMGASKLLMEKCIMDAAEEVKVSTARFANVAFSDGSLLHGFQQRLNKQQPIAVPQDIKRYFVTPEEAGKLCLLSCLLGDNKDIFYPKHNDALPLVPIAQVAVNFLKARGLEPVYCHSETEAKSLMKTLSLNEQWPCLLTSSDTAGEKPFEEFFEDNSELDEQRFSDIGVIKSTEQIDRQAIETFINTISKLRVAGNWSKLQLSQALAQALPSFEHHDTGKYLDSKM